MSAVTARALPVASPSPRRAAIRAVETSAGRRPKLVRAAGVLVVLGAIFAAQLLLSILVSSGAYEIAALQSQQKNLDRTAAALREELDVLASTQYLAESATVLGMVQGTGAAYLRLSDGAILAAPGATPRNGCAASCALVPNSLLAGMPVIQPPAPGTLPGTTIQNGTTGTSPNGTAQTGTAVNGGTAAGSQTTTNPVSAPPSGPQTGTIPAPVTR